MGRATSLLLYLSGPSLGRIQRPAGKGALGNWYPKVGFPRMPQRRQGVCEYGVAVEEASLGLSLHNRVWGSSAVCLLTWLGRIPLYTAIFKGRGRTRSVIGGGGA